MSFKVYLNTRIPATAISGPALVLKVFGFVFLCIVGRDVTAETVAHIANKVETVSEL